MKPTIVLAGIVVLVALAADSAMAHVPYLERRDFTPKRPFLVRGSIEQSIAVYSWIRFDGSNPATDVDVFAFDVTEPVVVYAESIVPMCAEYENFLPWFAVVGPGFPAPEYEIPFDIPPGYGAVVIPNLEPGQPRPTFYEFFGGKSYYQGPAFEAKAYLPGRYYVIYWDPYQQGGDYVAVLGNKEIWGLLDIVRAIVYTPRIRRGSELHTDCR
jgi:hypothetical protein